MLSRIAMISMHTSPLEQPGAGDAGGMNVYIDQTARRLANRGVAVDVFTRAKSPELPPVVEPYAGVSVRNVPTGSFEQVAISDLADQLCPFTWAVLKSAVCEANQVRPYDVVHSHYWLSGQVGRWVAPRWGAPLVHTGHTWAAVKNATLAPGDKPEPPHRSAAEAGIVVEAHELFANTRYEAAQLGSLYRADAEHTHVVTPGVDLERFHPGDRAASRREYGIAEDAFVVLFVGRVQPLKGPDVVLRAAALLAERPELRQRLVVIVCGGRSGSTAPSLVKLAAELGISDLVRFMGPLPAAELSGLYRAADVTVVPSRNESFGLVAAESQASGTPVVAAMVGGLPTVVSDEKSGVLIPGHDPADYAAALADLAADPLRRARLATGAIQHAARFSWENTVDGMLEVYELAQYAKRRTLCAC